jgi:hypothetical protein
MCEQSILELLSFKRKIFHMNLPVYTLEHVMGEVWPITEMPLR